MLTVNTNTTSLITQLNLSKSNNLVKTSIERMSTGFKINRASDDAANMSISKNMECQISGTNVALDNAQQAVNLLQTADGALDNMQANLLRIRDLTVQAMNGTYSSEEKAMIQGEIDNLLAETYKQRNSTMFNQIRIFGDVEELPLATTVALDGGGATTESVNLNNATAQVGGTHPVTPLTEEEAISQGYTCIHNEAEFAAMVEDNYIDGKYCLMEDIDFSQISNWGSVILDYGAELNGNGYSVNNLTINSTTNSDMQGLFYDNYGTIKNLNLNNVSIDIDSEYIGGLITQNDGRIENCSVSGSIKGGNYTGGLVGRNMYETIKDCSSSATVTGNDSTGGLVGYNEGGTITDCSSSGTVTGTGYDTGGLVGYNQYGTITDCSSSGTVTGNNNTGGLMGGNFEGTITNCSSSGNVTGNIYTGGLVGYNDCGTIGKSYATGDVSGNNYVGGLAGSNNNCSNISNSYALGNVSGINNVGGFIGNNDAFVNISKSYSTGNVEGTGSNVGGFVGVNGDEWGNTGNINNSYTTSEEGFIGNNYGGTVENNHGRTTQEGVTAHDESWFNDGSNLSFLGSAYDTSTIPPQIIGNERPIPPDPPVPPTPGGTEIQFQIGANSGVENTITIDTGFSLNGLTADVSTLSAGEKTLNDIDGALERMSSFRSTIGAMQNRLESISQSLATRKNNMESSHSTIMDTDFALETSKLVQNQILQNVAASLLAQANSNPNIALTLLK